mmetsp:Transcript_3108/g.8016  ORF Transcript_3108/g.8016 Transcript_3108/m.8016 type:complete len:243 (+) Transcript_3108:54-782(+)
MRAVLTDVTFALLFACLLLPELEAKESFNERDLKPCELTEVSQKLLRLWWEGKIKAEDADLACTAEAYGGMAGGIAGGIAGGSFGGPAGRQVAKKIAETVFPDYAKVGAAATWTGEIVEYAFGALLGTGLGEEAGRTAVKIALNIGGLFAESPRGTLAQCYTLLELDSSASDEEVRRAFHRLSLLHHPDKGGDEKRFASRRLQEHNLSQPRQEREGALTRHDCITGNRELVEVCSASLRSWS